MRVLVVGDDIRDVYHWGRVDRICPEAPVPVFVSEWQETRPGGAALVAANLKALGCEVETVFGFGTEKHRFMAGRNQIMRWDRDASGGHFAHHGLEVKCQTVDAVVVSDYGKGTINRSDARILVESARGPVFVDAKHHWDWYGGAFAAFPNQHESVGAGQYEHIIHKLGDMGCVVDEVRHIPAVARQVYDVTGAGDVFLAGFVAHYLEHRDLVLAAEFANQCAGISVEQLGTYVLTGKDVSALTQKVGVGD